MRAVSIGMVLICGNLCRAATHTWISFDGNFAASSSWSSGKAPSEWLPGDRVIFSGIDTPATTGLDQSEVRVASVLFDDAFDGQVGGPGNLLSIVADWVVFRGTGDFYFRNPPSPRMSIVISDADFLTHLDGDYDWLFIRNGVVDLMPTINAHTVLTGGGENFNAPNVYIPIGASIKRLVSQGAYITNDGDVGRGSVIEVDSGTFQQKGVIQTGATVRVTGGYFIYDPFNDPVIPGPHAEFRRGVVDLSKSFYEFHFSGGFASPFCTMETTDSLSAMGLLDLGPNFPALNNLNYGDTDGDGIPDLMDDCDGNSTGDTDGDCRITLKDFAALQNAMSGP